MKTRYLLLLIMTVTICEAQQTIPNGDFEEWYEEESNSNIYLLPEQWTESITNIFGRIINGIGFFLRYEGNDANGYAALLYRSNDSQNNGFIRYEFTGKIPSKLKGKYKFVRTNNMGFEGPEVDTLMVYAYFSITEDTLSLTDLHMPLSFPKRAKRFMTYTETDIFTDFEIDLSDFQTSGETYNYFTIQLFMQAENQITPTDSYAVIDDLELDYVLSTDIKEVNFKNIAVYPNPFINNFIVENAPIESEIDLYNSTGKLIYHTKLNHSKTVQTSQLKNGLYYMIISKDNRMIYSKKIIKK